MRRQGFEFVPILGDLFPPGTARTLREMARTGAEGEGRMAEIAAAAAAGPASVHARSWRALLAGD
ncbi:MAG TPA: hypothetical protein VJ885_03845, partial [Thermoanaerobaculia bacterium]|nr:hypothetical protein [Thermoanaerobaculia bacterium]